MTEAVYFAAPSLELQSSAPCVARTRSFSFDMISVASSGRPLSPARTLGGTIMFGQTGLSRPRHQNLDIKTWISKIRAKGLLAAQKLRHHLTCEGIRHVGFYPRHIR